MLKNLPSSFLSGLVVVQDLGHTFRFGVGKQLSHELVAFSGIVAEISFQKSADSVDANGGWSCLKFLVFPV